MSGIVRQVEWDRQPPGSISASRGLLGSSLVFAQSAQHVDYDGNQAVEAGALTARPSGVLKEVTSVSYPIRGSVSATQGYTFIHYGVRTGSHSSYYAMLRVLTGGNHIAGFELSETSKHYLFEMSSGGSPNFTGYGTPVTSPLDEEALFIGVVSPGGNTVLYKNGVVVATQASHTSLRSGGALTIVSAAISTQVALFQGVLLRAMAPPEVFAISSNPRLLFGPAVSHVPFASGGGAAALAGAATSGATATGALTTAIPILGAAVSGATASGSLSTAISLTGATATISGTAAGDLSATIRLAGDAVSGAIAAGGLATGIPLVGDGTGGAAGAGDLSTGSGLAGAGAAGAAGTGVLTTQITLSGAAIAQAIASGALTTTPAGLAGDGTSSSSGSGALSTGIPLAGAAAVSVVGTGGLVTAIPLAGAAIVAVSATGDLVVSLGLAGAALISAIGSGALLASITLSGAAVAGAVGAGALSGAALHASPWRTVTSLARVRRCIAGVR